MQPPEGYRNSKVFEVICSTYVENKDLKPTVFDGLYLPSNSFLTAAYHILIAEKYRPIFEKSLILFGSNL